MPGCRDAEDNKPTRGLRAWPTGRADGFRPEAWDHPPSREADWPGAEKTACATAGALRAWQPICLASSRSQRVSAQIVPTSGSSVRHRLSLQFPLLWRDLRRSAAAELNPALISNPIPGV